MNNVVHRAGNVYPKQNLDGWTPPHLQTLTAPLSTKRFPYGYLLPNPSPLMVDTKALAPLTTMRYAVLEKEKEEEARTGQWPR